MKKEPMQTKTSHLLYFQIADKVKNLLADRELKPHDPVPSEGELAKMYGVSRMTTKLALDLLAEQRLVYRLPRRGTFLAGTTDEEAEAETAAQESGAQAEGKRTKKMAIIVSNLLDYMSRIVTAVEQEARKYDCDLILKITSSKEDEDDCLQRLVEAGVDGIILLPQRRATCSDQVLRLKLQNFPIVIIDRIFREIQIDCVYHDHYQGSYRMAQYLIERGHTEIGYISNSIAGITSREDRYQGYMQALIDHAIPVNTGQIHINTGQYDLERIQETDPELEKFFRKNERMTAVMCGDDYVAISALYTALNMKMSVPDRLSIAGFSDIRLSALLPVPLTTVRQSTEQLGQSAVGLLMERIEQPKAKQVTIKIQTTIVERQSVCSRR